MNKGTIKIGAATAAVLLMGTVAMAGGDILPVEPVVKAPTSDWSSKHKFFGFSQVGAKWGDGAKLGDEADLAFEADRVRLGWKYWSGPLAAKVFLDFAKSGDGNIEVPNMIKDAFITYKFDDAAVVKAGVIKTPVGMGFTIPGWNLDVIKRGFDKKLAFERAFGVMLSGRDIGFGNNGKVDGLEMGHERPWKGFGYDLMVTGATGRSGAVKSPDEMSKAGNAYMGRVMFDWGQELHAEASYGETPNADGITASNGAPDYEVLNLGIDSHFDRANVKAEYYDVSNIRGTAGWDMNTLALSGTYYLTDTLEAAVKYIGGSADKGGLSADAANTYIGLNYFINPKDNKMDRKGRRSRNKHRVQLNYVLASGDTAEFADVNVGSFFADDAILMQYQFKF